MYFTDRGIEELADRRGQDMVTLGWLAAQLQIFAGLYPGFGEPVGELAAWLARAEGEDGGWLARAEGESGGWLARAEEEDGGWLARADREDGQR